MPRNCDFSIMEDTAASNVRPDQPRVSIVSAAYNEERNLPVLYARLVDVLDEMNVDWEWIIVDDHSSDRTFATIQRIADEDPRVRGLRFARNFGSHTAIMCGLNRCSGDCAIVLSSDLQDPPETIPELLEGWRSGAEVVWAVRRSREGDGASTVLFARLYYFMLRHVVGLRETPATGADFFLIGRRGIDTLCASDEGNVSLTALVTWMGFEQDAIEYDRQPRLHGRSGWSLEKKLKLVADSITAFSYLPIRVMSLLGALFAIGGLLLAVMTVIERLLGYTSPYAGYAMMTTIMLLGFGFVMGFLGVLGEYLWRTFDAVRGRPRFIVEDVAVNRKPKAPPMRPSRIPPPQPVKSAEPLPV